MLLAVCKPGATQILEGYSYDTDRMTRIDLFRHRLVHQAIEKSSDVVEREIEFMARTQVYLSALVTHRHGIRLTPAAMNPLVD